ncbi:hypothetical protein L211DRAFT_852328 [Terfezia boudieri ATCC MYA-4762]|uniref:Uncharacterized protein n=1 Tax=Terfezia boudieri ATCC MYA-4762 TaxID=1051890 RepID=A0A3N4LC66_9PEZI|nr:hypothetical protein L211DRAFT_852328 [Terfezia boudieri ATCC MYA-4762]
MKKSIRERHSLPSIREIPRSGPAKANDIRFATLRGRNQPPAPLKTVPELQAKEVDPNTRGDPVKNPTVSAQPGNLVTNICGRSLLAPPSLSSISGNSSHLAASGAETAKESHPPNISSIFGKDYPENTIGGIRSGYDSIKQNSPQTTHEVALQSYRVARQNGAAYIWERAAASCTGAQNPPIDGYGRNASRSSTVDPRPISQKTFHNTENTGDTLNPSPGSSQTNHLYHTDHSIPNSTIGLGTLYPEALCGPTPYPEPTPYPGPSRPNTALSQNRRGISPSRPSTPSTFRIKSLVKKASQLLGMSNASRSTISINARAASVTPEIRQPKQHQINKRGKTRESKDNVKTVTVQTQAQMFLEIARKAERKGKTVYFASTTGSTFVLTNDSCAGAYTAISLSTANLAGQMAPSLMGAGELLVDGKNGRKGLLFLLSPQQIMGLLPFEKVDVEKEGKSEMHGFGAKAKLGHQFYEHEWQDGEDRRFTLALHLAKVKVRGPGHLLGEISAVFWA